MSCLVSLHRVAGSSPCTQFAHGAWRNPKCRFEGTGEVELISEAGFLGDLFGRGALQPLGNVVHFQAQEIVVAFQEYRGEGNALQRQPDYCAPSYVTEYLPRLRKFLTTYRDRYCQPGSPVMMNQVRGFGDWGEWHTVWSHYQWPSREDKRRVLSQLIGVYLDVFAGNRVPGAPVPELSIAQVYDDDCGGETPLDEAIRRQALDVALTNGLTFSRHGFIDGMGGWPNDFILKFWKQSPMIAEANWSYEQVKRDKNHGTTQEFIDAFLQFHSTYAHMYLHADSYKKAMAEDRAEFERALKPGGIGYRFALTSASWESTRRPGQVLTLRHEWVNRNRGSIRPRLAR